MGTTSQAVILAAGVGSRLRPLTDDRPKALVDVGGETIVARAIRHLIAHGVQEVILATGYREDALKEALQASPVEVVYCRNDEYDRTQNCVSLALCGHAARGAGFFLLDGDVVFAPEILDRLETVDAPLVAAIDSSSSLDAEAMKLSVLCDGRVTAFGKGLPIDDSAGESIGMARLDARAGERLFDLLDHAIAQGRRDLYYEDFFTELIADGLRAAAVDVAGLAWTEVDTPEDLVLARALVSRERRMV